MKLPENQPARAHSLIDEAHDSLERPLRLDRQALRLDPPVVRFEEDRAPDASSR